MESLIFISVIVVLTAVIILLLKKLSANNKTIKGVKEQADSDKQALNQEINRLKEKLSPITDIEKEIAELNIQIEGKQESLKELSKKYKEAKTIYQELLVQVRIYQEDLELMDFGVYNPQFDFDTSEKYKEEIKEVVEKQKELVKDEKAAICNTNWSVGNSQKQGEIMIKRGIKLTLRAFNGECDSLIAKVKWNNIEQYSARIEKAFDNINKLNKSNDIHITEDYKELKLKELRLAHEYANKKYEEKEEQRRIREQIREDERAQRELEKVQKEAEEKEQQYQKALEKAQKELEKAQGAELEKLNSQIAELQQQLSEAHEVSERAMSRAQMTKSGHVYVISNIGSFGENVYKIGMTRRLEPMDRVKELGDASVPFQFDVHAMIYSENAPELENTLHKEFNDKRVNLVNTRKEYFNVSLSEIEEAVKNIHGAEIEFTKLAEAEEYRETLSLIKQFSKELQENGTITESKFPEDII